MKISGAYIRSLSGPPTYADVGLVAAALALAAPERMLWGSDWPHPTKPAEGKPNDAALLDNAMAWVASASTWNRMLVANPVELYSFSDHTAPALAASIPREDH